MITIYKTGLVDFTDHNLVKPVKFTEDDLRFIASSTSSCDVTDEHTDTVLASISNFIVEDGCLKTNKPKDLDITGKGLSPVFNCDELIDMGDFYKPVGICMSSVGLTKTPRNHILYNSVGSNGEDKMTDDVQLRQALDDNRKLTEEIGELKAQVKSLSKKLKEKDDKITELNESNKESTGKLKDYDNLVEKSKLYDELLEEERKTLIDEITNGDEKLAEDYSNFSTENLRVLKKNLTVNRRGRGVDNTNYNPINGNETNPPVDDEYTDEMFEEDFKASGL